MDKERLERIWEKIKEYKWKWFVIFSILPLAYLFEKFKYFIRWNINWLNSFLIYLKKKDKEWVELAEEFLKEMEDSNDS